MGRANEAAGILEESWRLGFEQESLTWPVRRDMAFECQSTMPSVCMESFLVTGAESGRERDNQTLQASLLAQHFASRRSGDEAPAVRTHQEVHTRQSRSISRLCH